MKNEASGRKPASTKLYRSEDIYTISIIVYTEKNSTIHQIFVSHMKSMMAVTMSVAMSITETTGNPAKGATKFPEVF